MIVELVFWNWRRLGVSWNTVSGDGRLKLSAPTSSLGWACRSKGTWFGLWREREGGDWILQHGGARWPLKAAIVSLEQAGKERVFRIVGEDGVVLRHAYVSGASSLLRRFDPTYDALDEEMEDFFLWTARSGREARRANGPQP